MTSTVQQAHKRVAIQGWQIARCCAGTNRGVDQSRRGGLTFQFKSTRTISKETHLTEWKRLVPVRFVSRCPMKMHAVWSGP